MTARLRILSSPDASRVGQIIHLGGGEPLTIGRDPTCTLPLQDDQISRHHAALHGTPEGYRVVDAGSSNGTRVNDRQVVQQLLAPGDRIRVGDTVLVLEAQATAAELPRTVLAMPAPAASPAPTLAPDSRRGPWVSIAVVLVLLLVLGGAGFLLAVRLLGWGLVFTPAGQPAPRTASGGEGQPARMPPESDGPFTLRYTLDEQAARYYAQGESLEALAAAGPLYGGAAGAPGWRSREFIQAREAKVEQLLTAGEALAQTARELRTPLAGLRESYFIAAGQVLEQQPRLEGFARASLGRLARLAASGELSLVVHDSLQIHSPQAPVKAAMQYLRLARAVQAATLTLEDTSSVAGYAALLLDHLKGESDPGLQQVAEQLERQMQGLDGLAGELSKLERGVQSVEQGLRQLQTADHYLGREALRFILARLPDLKKVLEAARAREGLSAQDLEFARQYLAYFARLAPALDRRLSAVNEGFLIKKASAPSPAPNIFAAGLSCSMGGGDDDLPPPTGAGFYGRATGALGQPAEPPAPRRLTSKIWGAVKSGMHRVQQAAGTTLDMMKHTAYVPIRIASGLVRGNTEFGEDLDESARQIAENARQGRAGSEVLRTAKQGMKSLERGADRMTADAVGRWTGEGKLNWMAGKVARASMSMFTGLAKGLYSIADETSTTGELAEGVMEIGFSAMGGSRVIMRTSQIPGLVKGVGQGGMALAQKVPNMIFRLAEGQEKQALKQSLALLRKLGREFYKSGIKKKQLELLLSRGISQSLEASNRVLNEQLRELVARGALGFGKNALRTLNSSMRDLVRKQFSHGLREYLRAAGVVLGKDALSFLDNVVGTLADDELKRMTRVAIDRARLAGSYVGELTGTGVHHSKIIKTRRLALAASITFSVAPGGACTGKVAGSWGKSPLSGAVSGSFDPDSRVLTAEIKGKVGKGKYAQSFSGVLTGELGQSSARGSFKGTTKNGSGAGSWVARRRQGNP